MKMKLFKKNEVTIIARLQINAMFVVFTTEIKNDILNYCNYYLYCCYDFHESFKRKFKLNQYKGVATFLMFLLGFR